MTGTAANNKSTPPCPANTVIHTLTDHQVGYAYIQLPEDTVFLESIAHNDTFAPRRAFIAVQRCVSVPNDQTEKRGSVKGGEYDEEGQYEVPDNATEYTFADTMRVKETHIYEIRVGQRRAKHICGPLLAPDGSRDMSIFGSTLSNTGFMYMCAFDRNSILGLNLCKVVAEKEEEEGTSQSTGYNPAETLTRDDWDEEDFPEQNDIDEKGIEVPLEMTLKPVEPRRPVTCDIEITGVSSPNDVAIDPNHENVLYVAGGTMQRLFCVPFSNAAEGVLYKITLPNKINRKASVTVYGSGMHTLAGIEVAQDGELWVAELFDIFRQEKPSKRAIAWKGDDGDGTVWMADNVDTFDETMLLCPAYSTTSEVVINSILKNAALSSFFLVIVHLFSAILQRESVRKALRDPEVSLSFSNTYIKEGEDPKPVRLIFLQPKSSDENSQVKAYHFEIDLQETRANHAPWDVVDLETGQLKGRRNYFNDQVTHAAQLKADDGGSYIVCLNFEEPRLLVLQDKIFRKIMAQPQLPEF